MVLSHEDLATILREVMPLTLRLGEQQWIALEWLDASGEPSNGNAVVLVPDVGMRVTCKAKVKWPLLGIGVPVTIHRLVVTFAPEILHKDGGDLLVFGLRLDHADFAGLPDAIDKRLSKAIDDALVARRLDLAWKFTETLAGSVPLPSTLDPIDGVSLEVAWGKIKVTAEAMAMAFSVHHAFHRKGDAPTAARANLPEKQAQNAIVAPTKGELSAAALLVVVGAGALLGGVLGAWMWRRR